MIFFDFIVFKLQQSKSISCTPYLQDAFWKNCMESFRNNAGDAGNYADLALKAANNYLALTKMG